MAFRQFSGERNLGDLVESLYGKLKKPDAEVAARALVEANPQLKNLRALGRGAVLAVPRIPGRTAAHEEVAEPVALGAGLIDRALGEFSKQLAGAAEAELAAVAGESKLAASAAVRRLVEEVPEARAALEETLVALKERERAAAEAQKFGKEILRKARKQLAEVADGL